jgi:hypothetical protein
MEIKRIVLVKYFLFLVTDDSNSNKWWKPISEVIYNTEKMRIYSLNKEHTEFIEAVRLELGLNLD